MTSDPHDDALSESSPQSEAEAGARKRKVRTHTPRPDDLTHEVLEFIAAIDDYKRRNMRSFLENTEILTVLLELGYCREGEASEVTDRALDEFQALRERYREEEGRLFPTWSEVFRLLSELGYARAA